jgi:PTH2 family peptidyl-tRNA hydrolase
MMSYKITLIMRMDLGMSTGKMIAQACHAAVEANEEAKRHKHKAWRNWKQGGAKKIALQCESLRELEELEEEARKLDLISVKITDAGHTEVPPGSVTCLAVGPDRADLVDRVTGKLPLL